MLLSCWFFIRSLKPPKRPSNESRERTQNPETYMTWTIESCLVNRDPYNGLLVLIINSYTTGYFIPLSSPITRVNWLQKWIQQVMAMQLSQPLPSSAQCYSLIFRFPIYLKPSSQASQYIWPNGIIFHQPRFRWNVRGFPFLSYLLGWGRYNLTRIYELTIDPWFQI